MKRLKKFLSLLVAAVFLLESCYINEYDDPTIVNLNDLKAVTVNRVVDGDTFIYEEDGNKIRVRCIGIDTPESVAPEETGKVNTEEGKIVSDYVKELIEGQTVYLDYDVEQYDQFGRELAYVYLSDGRMLETILLSMGYAETMTIEPDTKYADYFLKLQNEAKDNKVGMWK